MLSTKKELLREYLLPLIIEFFITAILIFLFMFSVKQGILLQDIQQVGDEMTSPTLGRLIYGIVSFILFVVLSVRSSFSANNNNDTKAFWLGYIAGILLWQSVGEISWHFSIGGVNFSPLENITSFPICVLSIMLFVYCRKNHSFDWGVLITYLSFMCNWVGHYVTIGIYPFFASLIDEGTFIILMSILVGLITLVLSFIYIYKRARTKKGRMLGSILTYIGIAVIAFGFIEG